VSSIQLVKLSLFPEVMGPESEPDNLPLPNAEVEYEYGHNFTFHMPVGLEKRHLSLDP